jgi:YVTN family beta-propeller protein
MAEGRHRPVPRRRSIRRWSVALVAGIVVCVLAASAVAEIREPEDEHATVAARPGPTRSVTAAPSRTPTPSATPTPRPHLPVNIYRHTRAGDMSPKVRGFPERVYVPDNTTDTVTVIDPATFRIVRTFKAGAYPQHITPAWNLRRLYVDNSGDDTLTVIDPRTARPVRTIRGIPAPYNLYFTPDGTRAIDVVEYQNRVEFRDPHTWKLVHALHVPWPGVDHGDFTAGGRFLLMSTEYSGRVIKINADTMRLVGSVVVGGRPIDIKSAPDGRVFYVANQGLNGVTMLGPRHLHVLGFIPTGAGAHGLAVSRDARFLYVANRMGGSISVISFATRRVVATWPVGGSPDMLQVSPDGSQLWTSNRFDGTVSVIDTRTGHVMHVIRTGIKPHGLAYFPQPGRFSIGHNGVFH